MSVPETKDELPPEINLSVPEIVALHGYTCDELIVTTTDGYQLTVFRVRTFAASFENSTSCPAVLLQHGLLSCAANWVSIRVLKNLKKYSIPSR
jgi:hypothetical protein